MVNLYSAVGPLLAMVLVNQNSPPYVARTQPDRTQSTEFCERERSAMGRCHRIDAEDETDRVEQWTG